MCFFTEYVSEEDYFPVRNLRLISIRYLKSTFVYDLLTIIPFRYMIQDRETMYLLQLFKLLRLPRLTTLISHKQIDHYIKTYYDQKFKSLTLSLK